jgi:small subunit ribosomal protein S20
MPNIKSAKKRVLVTEVKNARNRALKTELKTKIKTFETAAGEEAKAAYTEAVKSVDQAVAKGAIHKNTAARRKSQMTKKLNKGE